jgi:3-hydroxyacyl-[acyl-carrier-protein] dehydratase
MPSPRGIRFPVVASSAARYTGWSDFSTLLPLAQADDRVGSPMQFTLIDRIVELEPGVRITAVKSLTMAEEYLADHFPRFPVMPGVLMLEAMTQTAAWLVRVSEDFAHSMVVLKQATNVKYGQFVEPGQTLHVAAEIVKSSDRETKLKARGTVDGRTTVGARLVLAKYNLADTVPAHAEIDRLTKEELRNSLLLLYQPTETASERSLP